MKQNENIIKFKCNSCEIIDSLEDVYCNYDEEFPLYEYYSYEQIIEIIDNGKIDLIFMILDKKYRLDCFTMIFNYIEDEYKYKFFQDIYSAIENGFSEIPGEIFDEIKRLKPRKTNELLNEFAEDGYLTIYRGEGSKSSHIESSLSWSLNNKVAKFFATRFDNEGKLYSGKVHVNDVICFLTDRNEEEVLVKFNDIQINKVIEVSSNQM